jgi:hypothetical protein
VTNPDELFEVAARREVDERAFAHYHEQAQRHQQLMGALERNELHLLLPPDKAREFAAKVAQQWYQEQEEEKLPPAEKAMRQRQRQLDEQERRIQAFEKQRAAEAQAREEEYHNQQAVSAVKTAMEKTGLPLTQGLARQVAQRMAANLASGRNYPPEVVAKQVRTQWLADQSEAYKAMPPAQLLNQLPVLLEALENLEDPALLAKLPKLTDRLRRLGLEQVGVKPGAQPSLSLVRPPKSVLPDGREPQTPEDFAKLQDLRARGLL